MGGDLSPWGLSFLTWKMLDKLLKFFQTPLLLKNFLVLSENQQYVGVGVQIPQMAFTLSGFLIHIGIKIKPEHGIADKYAASGHKTLD